jgi:hypothetical protein
MQCIKSSLIDRNATTTQLHATISNFKNINLYLQTGLDSAPDFF